MAIDSRCFYFIGIQDSLEVNTIELEVDIRIINICNSFFKFFNTSVYPEYYSDYWILIMGSSIHSFSVTNDLKCKL